MSACPASAYAPRPDQSLQLGRWVKLICGASYQDMPTIRRLVMLYALAGVDCVDVAADAAVVAAARQGLGDARQLAAQLAGQIEAQGGNAPSWAPSLPWLMVSLNDSEDPHFRKAHLDAAYCPPSCDRPCETLCPTEAIQFAGLGRGGVIDQLCYGCGRCIAVCPVENIQARSYQARPEDFPAAGLAAIDAIEIHTQAGRQAEFAALWQRLQSWRSQLKLVSVSFPDHPQIVAYLRDLYAIMAPLPIPLIWQTDGRPMSGDLGKGTTHATIRLAEKILQAGLPGHVQLAGGTNAYTVRKLRRLGLLRSSSLGSGQDRPVSRALPAVPTVAGIAYGSYARRLVRPLLEKIDLELAQGLSQAVADRQPGGQPFDKGTPFCPCSRVESVPKIESTSALVEGVIQARQLVGALKDGGR